MVTKLDELYEQRKELQRQMHACNSKIDEEIKHSQQRLESTLRTENPQSKATNAWCRITNALIRKYKPMTEQDPNKALKELTRIEGALLAGGFLTEQELKEAL